MFVRIHDFAAKRILPYTAQKLDCLILIPCWKFLDCEWLMQRGACCWRSKTPWAVRSISVHLSHFPLQGNCRHATKAQRDTSQIRGYEVSFNAVLPCTLEKICFESLTFRTFLPGLRLGYQPAVIHNFSCTAAVEERLSRGTLRSSQNHVESWAILYLHAP